MRQKKTILIILIMIGCTNDSIMVNQKYYGQYFSLIKHDIFLELKHPNNFYVMQRDDKESGHDNLVIISKNRGVFDIKGDSIQLMSNSQKPDIIKILNENVLIVSNIKGFPHNDTLYCFVKYDRNNKPVFNGEWENGKKSGDWIYFHKNYYEKVTYKNGIELKREMIELSR